MKRLGWLVVAGLLLAPPAVWGQGTGVNPPVGSVWTYLGATYGAGWGAPIQATGLPVAPVTCSGDAAANAGSLQNAISQVAAAGGGIVQLMPGNCTVNATSTISTSQTGIACAGYGKAMMDNYVLAKCTLQWAGAAGGTILKISAPMGTTANTFLYGNFVTGINFDGNNGLAANGLVIQSVRQGLFQGNNFTQFNAGVALDLNVVQASATNFSTTCDSQFNQFINNTVDQRGGYTSVGLRLGTWVNTARANSGCNASFNDFTNTNVQADAATGILLDGADNNHFLNTIASAGSHVGLDISIHNQGGGLVYPSNTNTFRGMSTVASGGGIVARGLASFPACVAFYGNSSNLNCTFGNTVYDLDAGNGGGGVYPNAELGAQFQYRWTDELELHMAHAPTLAGCTGLGAGGTCTLESGTRNEAGWVDMTAASGAAADGRVQIELTGWMGQHIACVATTFGGSSVSWDGRSTTLVAGTQLRSDNIGYDFLIDWHNSGIALTSGTLYRLGYICRGMNLY